MLVQPYDPRIKDGETALVFLGGRQSHAFTKGPILPPPGQAPVFDESGTYAEESLTPADPDFEVWDVGHAALEAAAAHLGMSVGDLLYARVDVIGDRRDARFWSWNWWSRRWAGDNSTGPRGPGSSGSSHWASNQPLTGSGLDRSRIDAHSAAVAAVQAAAPAHGRPPARQARR